MTLSRLQVRSGIKCKTSPPPVKTTSMTLRFCVFIGELWDADGLWTVLLKPSQSEKILFSGSILPAKVEIENNPDSKIAHYRRPVAPGELPLDAAEVSQGQKPTPQG